jgi:L-aspartate oxidase
MPQAGLGAGAVVSADIRRPLQEAMMRGAGVLRSAASLAQTSTALAALGDTAATANVRT